MKYVYGKLGKLKKLALLPLFPTMWLGTCNDNILCPLPLAACCCTLTSLRHFTSQSLLQQCHAWPRALLSWEGIMNITQPSPIYFQVLHTAARVKTLSQRLYYHKETIIYLCHSIEHLIVCIRLMQELFVDMKPNQACPESMWESLQEKNTSLNKLYSKDQRHSP